MQKIGLYMNCARSVLIGIKPMVLIALCSLFGLLATTNVYPNPIVDSACNVSSKAYAKEAVRLAAVLKEVMNKTLTHEQF